MSIDIFSQKLKLVKIYIKMYQSMIKLIKNTKKRELNQKFISEYYDRNSKDFENIIDEEVIAK